MKHFARHLIDRYGIDEVSQWYFEVWNEPNIDFWGGIPRQAIVLRCCTTHTARDLKSVSPRLRVGGPATAAASWIVPFLQPRRCESRAYRFCIHTRVRGRHG